ncbi:phage minor head protein [Sporomusa sp.]|uniref:phage minor head protein n=1 Tax=Sporomusa sp. TaxID=2078658 RepID=UPI002D1458AD|nr:phage minor head protein [Sporomusa sp.]HWR07110.1 phage minor head protein [Sporomusa sp.]
MGKVERLIKAINRIAKAEEDELKEEIAEFPAVDATLNAVEEYEKKVAGLFRAQRKHFVNGFKEAISKDETLDLKELLKKLLESDEFAEKMAGYTETFLTMTVEELTEAIMENIDEDVVFDILSQRTVDWIKAWSKDLAELMKLSTHTELEAAITAVIENGEGINKAIERIKDLPGFNRTRARTTAITEVLRANSVSAHEAFMQSPAVIQKTWKHSGAKKNKPRRNHVKLDGTSIGLDEVFDVGGHDGRYPRDSRLPPEESVNCHCVLGPVVDPKILGLSKEEKEKLRDQARKEADEKWAEEKK